MILTPGERVQQRGVRGGGWGRTVLLFRFADLRVALGELQTDRLRDVRIEPHALSFGINTNKRFSLNQFFKRHFLAKLVTSARDQMLGSFIDSRTRRARIPEKATCNLKAAAAQALAVKAPRGQKSVSLFLGRARLF